VYIMLFWKKNVKKKYETLMKESQKAKSMVAGMEPCDPPLVLRGVNVESIVRVFESPVIPAMIMRAYDSLSKYWCHGELGRMVLEDLERASKAGVLDKLLPAYLVALYDICDEYRQYRKEPICISLKQIHMDIKNLFTLVVSSSRVNPLRYGKLKKEIERLVRKDRNKLHKMYDEYENIMKQVK